MSPSREHVKAREVTYLLGLRPKPRTYAQWLHPSESRNVIPQEVVAELRKFVAPGGVVIDIGAHTGDTAIRLSGRTDGRTRPINWHRLAFFWYRFSGPASLDCKNVGHPGPASVASSAA